MKRAIGVVLLISILLVGCTRVKEEQVAYNVSMRDVVIESTKMMRDGYKGQTLHLILVCRIQGEQQKYELANQELYDSVNRLLKTYAISNPDEPVVVDLIYDTDAGKVISIALRPNVPLVEK